MRNVDEKNARYGPWLQADYEILNEKVWRNREACLYLVGSSDHSITYVGKSEKGLKARWRTPPAYDAEDPSQALPQDKLFHSQCWRYIEDESAKNPDIWFQVRSVSAKRLVALLKEIGPPVEHLAKSSANGGSVVRKVERWLRNHRSNELARWNKN